jgi:KaiC/GvpD/RAD55 family RecA-like ATPase
METLKTEWAVDSIVGLLRLILRGDLSQPGSNGTAFELPATSIDLAVRVVRECPDVPPEVCSAFAEKWLATQPPPGQNGLSETKFEELCNLLLPRDIYPEDARYFAMRGIRARSLITLSNFTVAAAHLLTNIVSEEIQSLKTHPKSYSEFRAEITGRLESDLVEKLRVGLVVKRRAGQPSMESLPKIIANRIFNAFVDMGTVLGFMSANFTGSLSLAQECTNAEYLMSRLFGIPTRIPGFDMLFGGGGLMLTDLPRFRDDSNALVHTLAKMIGGRSVLCTGRAGSGKTLLSLEFAVEVARKGGIVWVISFEQTDEECLYGLESIGISTRHPAFRVELGESVFDEALFALTDRAPTQGALVFLRPTDKPMEYPKFLETLEEHLQSMSKYPLRLIIVDPVSVFSQCGENAEDLRARARKMCESAKRANVNIWFTTDQLSENRFEENIADTVIDMGSDSQLGQPWRYIQVPKSRFQHEVKGRQALEIHSSHGIRIYPSSALVAEFVSNKQVVNTDQRLEFGVRGTEGLLGAEPIRPGDLIAIAGPGKGKNFLGAHFLLALAGTKEWKGSSLYVSDYSKDRMKRFLHSVAGEEAWLKCENQVDILSLVTGYIDPGRVLLEIDQALDRSQKKNPGTMRVLLTNLARWEEDIPYIRNDPSFGIALIKMIRSYNAATLIVCGDSLEDRGGLQGSIIDHSDFYLQSSAPRKSDPLVLMRSDPGQEQHLER